MARQMLSLVTAALTLWGMWLAGNKRSAGWIVGLVNQIFWLATIVAFGVWGLLPLTVALTVVYTRNLLKWRRDDKAKPLLDNLKAREKNHGSA
jgi:uncharacterized Tic20 family protein